MISRPLKPYLEDSDEMTISYLNFDILASRPQGARRIKDISIFLVDSHGWKDISDITLYNIKVSAKRQLDFLKQQREERGQSWR